MKHPISPLKAINKNEQTILEVEDFGRGIDPKDLPRIFDKGFTSTTKHQDNAATGMGLYLAKKAAKSLFITYRSTIRTWKRNDFYLNLSKKK